MIGQVVGAILAGVLLAGQDQTGETTLPDVSVTGARNTVEQTRRFVEEVSERPTHALTLSTWRKPICLQVVNLRESAQAAIVSRIATRAGEAGVAMAPTGCFPNVTVLATSDGRFTASELAEAYRDRFLPSPEYAHGDGEDLRRFAESEAAVRWWHVAALTDDETGRILPPLRNALAQFHDTTGTVFFGQDQRETILTALVIVDLSRTGGVTDTELGDYIAMVILADIDPEADAGSYPTVLNLWRDGPRGQGMTAWDQAYLKALYQADVRLTGSGLQGRSLYQVNEMARIISRELAQEPTSP